MSFRLNNRLQSLLESPRDALGMRMDGQDVLAGPWLDQVLNLADSLKNYNEDSVQIHSADSLVFLKYLLAVVIAGKRPIILPNQQPETIDNFSKLYPRRLNEQIEVSLLQTTPTFNSSDCNVAGNLKRLRNLPDLDQCQLILFTSGTTGKPKKVEKRIFHFVNEVETLESLFSPPKDSRILATVSHQHVYGMLFRMWWPFLTSRKALAATLEFPEQFQKFSDSKAHYSLITTPSFLKRLDPKTAMDLKNTNLLFSSGGPLSEDTALKVGQWLGHFPIEVYGSTESGGIAHRQGDPGGRPPWRLFPQVVGSNNAQGRLTLSSPFFGEKFLEMGDEVRWVSSQEFELVGRVDRLLKIEETRISLREMEEHFAEHPFVDSAYLLSSLTGRQELWGVVRLNASGKLALEKNGRFLCRQDFRKHLQKRFPPVVLPRRFRYIEEWPYDSRGKMDLIQMRELFND